MTFITFATVITFMPSTAYTIYARAVLAALDAKHFATPGKSTEQAIAYILHLVLENLDCGNCSARLFLRISERLLT